MIQEIKIRDLNILKDTKLQSPTLDSILLADFIKVNRHVKKVLEIGSGVGIISLLLAEKMKAKIIGVELQKELFELSIKNSFNNNLEVEYILDDIYNYAKNLYQEFDVIVTNPPYFVEKNENQLKKNESLQIARNEKTLSIEGILKISDKILKNRGHLYMIFRVERLDEIILYTSNTKLKLKEMQFVYTKKNANALFVLADFVKGVKSGVVVKKALNIE